MGKLKKNKASGITLIALVVTIIVLLILAGISIMMLTGDNGILTKAGDAKVSTEKLEAIEQAKIDIMTWITDKKVNQENASLDDNKVKTILTGKSYVKEAKNSSFITAKGEYEIPYSELYEQEGSNPPTDSLNELVGKNKSIILLKKNITIGDSTTYAHFYDCDFTTLDDYIEYNGAIYKVTYNVDYEGENPYATSTVSSVTSTDINIEELGRTGNNIITITHGNSLYYFEGQNGENIGGISSGFVEDTLFGTTCLFPYSEDGILTGAWMTGNWIEDYGEKGYVPDFQVSTD